MHSSRLDTVQVVPPTPFSPDGEQVLTDRLQTLVRELFAAGIRVFLPAAGTGEFHSLSTAEVVQCVAATRQAVPDGVVMAPLGFSIADAVAIGQGALDAGADCLLLMPPIHPYLSDSGFREYFLAIADRLGTPLLTYKRGPVPSDKLLLELGRQGKLRGVKYAVNDADAFARFALAAREVPGLGLYCGTAERWAPYFMLAGATGYTSGLGCLTPRLTLELHRLLAAGEWGAAMRWLEPLRPIEDYRARDADSFNISAIKFAVSQQGLDCGPCRPPQRRLTPTEQEEIRSLAATLLARERTLAGCSVPRHPVIADGGA